MLSKGRKGTQESIKGDISLARSPPAPHPWRWPGTGTRGPHLSLTGVHPRGLPSQAHQEGPPAEDVFPGRWKACCSVRAAGAVAQVSCPKSDRSRAGSKHSQRGAFPLGLLGARTLRKPEDSKAQVPIAAGMPHRALALPQRTGALPVSSLDQLPASCHLVSSSLSHPGRGVTGRPARTLHCLQLVGTGRWPERPADSRGY